VGVSSVCSKKGKGRGGNCCCSGEREAFLIFGVLFVCLFETKFGECREILEVLGLLS
jgi:hypothetical protein